MNKRKFLKTTSVIVAGGVFTQFVSCKSKPTEVRTNWAGNLQYHTDNFFVPDSVEEVQEFIKTTKKLRTLGTQHCFNTIADSDAAQISSRNFNKIISLDENAKTVTVEAGIKYGDLCKYLHNNGFALQNLASLPHISIAGACATATHGSGVKNGNLATPVSAIEFVNGKGEIVSLSRTKDTDEFAGAIISLGSVGFVMKLTLDLLPTFNMKQYVYRNLPMKALEKDFDTIMSAAYSVSLFTDWSKQNINQIWIKSVANANDSPPDSDFFGAKLADRNMHPIDSLSAENCTEQMGVAGVWYERMPHFKMGFTPSSGKELQSEFFVAREHAYEAMMAIEKLHEQITPHLFITEIRTVAADNLWMSPAYKKDCIIFHFTWKQETEEVLKLLPQIEANLAPFNPRPHWGKIFTMSPKVLQSRIEKLDDFKKLMAKHDPDRKFRNEFIDVNLFG